MQDPSRPTLAARNSRVAISAVFLVFGSLVGSWLPHIPDIQRQLGIDYSKIGSGLLCSGLGSVATMPFAGGLIHRFGSRHIAVAGGIGACILVPILLTHQAYVGLCVNWAFLGMCYGFLDVAMNSHAVQVQTMHDKPIISGIHGWFSAGGIVGGLSAAIASSLKVNPMTHLVLVSVCLITTLLIAFNFLLISEKDQDSEGPRLVFPRGMLLILGLLCVCAFVSEGGILDWSAVYVRSTLHATPVFGGIATAACTGAMAVGRFAGDSLLARFGNRLVVGSGGVLTFFGLLAAVSVPSVFFSIFCFALASFGIANMVPVFFNESSRVPGVPPSTAMAAVTTCGYSGFLLGPPIIGAAAHRISLGFSIGALSVLGLIVAIWSPRVLHDG